MRQAIEEGFILDVLTNYTTYATYYKLLKAAEDDPNLPKKKAARALAKFMSLHPHNIEQKTEVIIEHFRRSVMHRLGGRGKAMVVTSSRLHAVRYKLAFERYSPRTATRMCARWSRSAARCATRTPASSTPSPA
jgi:type I restriction enzyme R subunit